MAQKRIVRFIVFFLGTVVILFLLITLILPSTGRVMKETYIPVRKQVVFDQLTTLNNYASWYPWIQIGPSAKVMVEDNKQTLYWKSTGDKADSGMYELTGFEGDSVLHFRLRYNTVPPMTGAYILRASGNEDGTTLVWYINMKAGWTPWWRFYAAMIDKIAGPVMEAGLTNIKMLSEKADAKGDNAQ